MEQIWELSLWGNGSWIFIQYSDLLGRGLLWEHWHQQDWPALLLWAKPVWPGLDLQLTTPSGTVTGIHQGVEPLAGDLQGKWGEMGGASTGSPCPWKQGLIQISSVYPNQAQTSKKKKGNMSDAHSWNLTLYNIVGWGDRQNSSQQLPNGQRLTKQSESKPNPWPLQQIPSCNLLCIWHEAGGAVGSPWHSDSWLLCLY